MTFRIEKGGYWLQGENGWGQRECANVYATHAEAERVAKRLRDRGERVQCVDTVRWRGLFRWADRHGYFVYFDDTGGITLIQSAPGKEPVYAIHRIVRR